MHSIRSHAFDSLRSVRIGHVPVIANPALQHSLEERFPARAVCSFIARRLGLLECIVDRYRKGGMRLFRKVMDRLRHPVQEELSASALLPWRYGSATSSSVFGAAIVA